MTEHVCKQSYDQMVHDTCRSPMNLRQNEQACWKPLACTECEDDKGGQSTYQ